MNGSNKEVEQLISSVNKSLENINSKNTELNYLINKIDEFSKLNADKPNQIEQVNKKKLVIYLKLIFKNIDYVINKNIDLNENELEETLKQISNLAAKVNINDIDQETESSRLQSKELLDKSSKVGQELPKIFDQLNHTMQSIKQEELKVEQTEKNLNEFIFQNSNAESQVLSVII